MYTRQEKLKLLAATGTAEHRNAQVSIGWHSQYGQQGNACYTATRLFREGNWSGKKSEEGKEWGNHNNKAKGKAKEKEVATSPRGGEKCKKKKTVVKVANNDDNIVKVLGPSGKRSGFDPGPFLERLDRLTRVVEEMTGQMRWVVDATRSVARGNK